MNKFKFKTKLWKYVGPAAWYFISVPKEITHEINFYFSEFKRGWGSLPVKVSIGNSEWKTSIFPDKKSETFMLPVKKEVRKSENIEEGDQLEVILDVLVTL